MAELDFECRDVTAEYFAMAPTLSFRLRITETTGVKIDAIALRCQIRIQPQKRKYSASEAERVVDLFGETPRWGETLKPMQFTTESLMVPKFTGSTEINMPVSCTYDFEVAAAKYFHGLEDGEVPLLLMFSGTVFAKRDDGGMSVDQVPWHKEAEHRMPVAVWREMMDHYFPESGWIRLHRETLDALQRFKSDQAIATWDETLERLLERTGEVAP